MISETYTKMITDLIKNIVGGCDFLVGSVMHGTLTLIVNNGIVYMCDVSNQIPVDFYASINRYEIELEDKKTKTITEISDDMILIDTVLRRTMQFTLRDSINQFGDLIFYDPEFQNHPTFEAMRSGTMKEGQFKFILPTTKSYNAVLILFKGMFSMHKGDTVSLEIREVIPTVGQELLCGKQLLACQFIVNRVKLKMSIHIMDIVINLAREDIHYGITG